MAETKKIGKEMPMERVKPIDHPVRVKPIKTTERVKPIQHPRGVQTDDDGSSYYRWVHGVKWPCGKSGYLFDHETETHVSRMGKMFEKMTKKESEDCSKAIMRKMYKCFPHNPNGNILIRRKGEDDDD